MYLTVLPYMSMNACIQICGKGLAQSSGPKRTQHTALLSKLCTVIYVIKLSQGK